VCFNMLTACNFMPLMLTCVAILARVHAVSTVLLDRVSTATGRAAPSKVENVDDREAREQLARLAQASQAVVAAPDTDSEDDDSPMIARSPLRPHEVSEPVPKRRKVEVSPDPVAASDDSDEMDDIFAGLSD
jgi:hypothetical protein